MKGLLIGESASRADQDAIVGGASTAAPSVRGVDPPAHRAPRPRRAPRRRQARVRRRRSPSTQLARRHRRRRGRVRAAVPAARLIYLEPGRRRRPVEASRGDADRSGLASVAMPRAERPKREPGGIGVASVLPSSRRPHVLSVGERFCTPKAGQVFTEHFDHVRCRCRIPLPLERAHVRHGRRLGRIGLPCRGCASLRLGKVGWLRWLTDAYPSAIGARIESLAEGCRQRSRASGFRR